MATLQTHPDYEQRNCKGIPASVFIFDTVRGQVAKHDRRVERARRICTDCPIAAECLQTALDDDEVGIWGGTTEAQRRTMHYRSRPLGRPRSPLTACGTMAGYLRHHRAGDAPCDECRTARNIYESERRRNLKTRVA